MTNLSLKKLLALDVELILNNIVVKKIPASSIKSITNRPSGKLWLDIEDEMFPRIVDDIRFISLADSPTTSTQIFELHKEGDENVQSNYQW